MISGCALLTSVIARITRVICSFTVMQAFARELRLRRAVSSRSKFALRREKYVELTGCDFFEILNRLSCGFHSSFESDDSAITVIASNAKSDCQH